MGIIIQLFHNMNYIPFLLCFYFLSGCEVNLLYFQLTLHNQLILIHYLAERQGEINPSTEIKEWKWFDLNQLPEDCGPNIKPVIDEYLKK